MLSKEELIRRLAKRYIKKFDKGEITEFVLETCICCFYSMTREQLENVYNEKTSEIPM